MALKGHLNGNPQAYDFYSCNIHIVIPFLLKKINQQERYEQSFFLLYINAEFHKDSQIRKAFS